jgi:hypothetical protein
VKRHLLLLSLFSVLQSPAARAVVSATAVRGGGHIGLDVDHLEFQVDQNPAGTDYTCFAFHQLIPPYAPDTYDVGICLDESMDLFSVAVGEHLTREAILGLPRSALLGFNGQLFVPESSFYLGIYTPTRSLSFISRYPQAIGWVRITYSDGTFAVAESAMDFSGQGLIVGTTTVIPEGSASGSLLACLLCAAVRRRNKYV